MYMSILFVFYNGSSFSDHLIGSLDLGPKMCGVSSLLMTLFVCASANFDAYIQEKVTIHQLLHFEKGKTSKQG